MAVREPSRRVFGAIMRPEKGTRMSKRIYKGSLLATTIIAGLSIAMPAYAQDTDTTDEGSTAQTGPGVQPQEAVPPAEDDGGEIVITGTLIRNPNLTSSSPVAVVGQEEISLRQANTAETILRETPGVLANMGTNVNNGQAGSARIDLRGLGSQRNLVLLDGGRLVPNSFQGAVDLNNIPIALVDRIDVLTGGASTTYGADAVSGVVNFITKKNFAGIDLQLSESITERGDTNVLRADLVVGANFDDGRGNAVLGVGYIEADELYFGDRTTGFNVCNSTSGACGGDSPTSTSTGFAFGTGTAAALAANPTGPQTCPPVPPAISATLQLDPTGSFLTCFYNPYNFNPVNIYSTPFQRFNAFAQAHYDVSDRISVYARGLFSKNTISSIVAASGIFGEALTVPGQNPYLNTTIRNQLCAAAGIALGATCDNNPAIPIAAVYRRTVEIGPRIDEYVTNIFDIKAGFTWNFTDNISLDVYGARGESENRQARINYPARSRFQQALNATTVTTCTSPTQTTAPAGCVPVDLFGPVGSITPEQAAFLGGLQSYITNKATLSQVRGLVSGDFGFTMPWSAEPVAFAVGAEHRDYGAIREPDSLAQVPGELGGAGGAIRPLKGGYTAEDFFGEVIVPIAADRPFMHELQLEAGIRYSKYAIEAAGNPKFNATTYKIGGTWAPIRDVKFRGSYQKAVRAPTIGELFAPVVTGLTTLATDPCAGAAPVGNANLTLACVGQGAPAGTIGSIPNPAAGQANATGGGNPLLSPETAKTFTVGAVFTPGGILPGFNASIDYYRIKITDAITAQTPGDSIANCFGTTPATITAAQAASAACTVIRRNPTTGALSGSVATTIGLPAPLTNNGRLFTDGVDFTANYRRDLGFADLILNFNGNWTNRSMFQASASSYNRDCVGYYSGNCGVSYGTPTPEWTWNQRSTLSFKHVDLSLLWRHLTAVKYEGLASDAAARGVTPPLFVGTTTGVGPLAGRQVDFNRIDAYDYFDLTSRFNVTDHFELTLSAFNIFDKQPPLVGGQAGTTSANSGNTFPSVYDVLGRRYSVTARVKF